MVSIRRFGISSYFFLWWKSASDTEIFNCKHLATSEKVSYIVEYERLFIPKAISQNHCKLFYTECCG